MVSFQSFCSRPRGHFLMCLGPQLQKKKTNLKPASSGTSCALPQEAVLGTKLKMYFLTTSRSALPTLIFNKESLARHFQLPNLPQVTCFHKLFSFFFFFNLQQVFLHHCNSPSLTRFVFTQVKTSKLGHFNFVFLPKSFQ